MSQLFHEALTAKKVYKQLLKQCCGGGPSVGILSNDPDYLESTASKALHDIVHSLDNLDMGWNSDNKTEIAHVTSCLEKKLLQRWKAWGQNEQRTSARVLLKQASDIKNKRSDIEVLKKELSHLYLSLCNAESQVSVGMEAHVKHVMELLKSRHVVAVWGLPGIGKSRLLQCVEEEVKRRGEHVVAHVEVRPERQQNVEELQQSIQFQLITKPAAPFGRPRDPEHGRQQLAQCFRTLQAHQDSGPPSKSIKGVCLIVDGIRSKQFLRELLPPDMRDLFSARSFLITSSRDKGLARAFLELCCHNPDRQSSLYMIPPLQDSDAKMLFCANAESQGLLLEDHDKNIFATDITNQCGGLPLALIICGNHFSYKDNRTYEEKERISKLLSHALKESPSRAIFKTLEETIEDKYMEPFLDIALFLEQQGIKKG